MKAANGVPIIGGPKLYTKPAQNVKIVDRGLYDMMHFLIAVLGASQGSGPPPWGEPIPINRPLGNGLMVTTIFVPYEDAPAAEDKPESANDGE